MKYYNNEERLVYIIKSTLKQLSRCNVYLEDLNITEYKCIEDFELQFSCVKLDIKSFLIGSY